MNGKGKFTWPSGSEYEGDYVNGIREGSGKFTWSNGKVFKGDFNLIDERARMIREVFTIIKNNYEGSCSNFVKQCGKDATKLVKKIML